MATALSLVCKQCNQQLKSVKEAQEHNEVTGHTQFEESTEAVCALGCVGGLCGCMEAHRHMETHRHMVTQH